MTPEEIKALITGTLETMLPQVLKSSFTEFQSHFEGQLKPINERLSQFEVVGGQDEPEEHPGANDPLTKRLAKLEADLKAANEREQQRVIEAQQARFDSTLQSALGAKGNVLHQNIVAELLTNRLKNGAVEKDGKWITKDGHELSEAVEEFFKSEQGLHFLPSRHQNGLGTPAPRNVPNAPRSTKDVSLEEMLAEGIAF